MAFAPVAPWARLLCAALVAGAVRGQEDTNAAVRTVDLPDYVKDHCNPNLDRVRRARAHGLFGPPPLASPRLTRAAPPRLADSR